MWRFCRKYGRNSSKNCGWSLVNNEVCFDKTCVICRKELPKSPWKCMSFRKIVGAWLLSHLLLQKLLCWQACFLLLLVGEWNMSIWPRLCEISKEVSSLWPCHWEMLVASLELDCWGTSCWPFIPSPRTGPNVSAFRPDYLFHTVIGVWEVIPSERVKLKTYRTDHW